MDKIKIKKIIKMVVFIPVIAYLLYASYYTISQDSCPVYRDCGEIISKSNDEVAIKYGVKTELYLNIQFDNSGFRSIRCDPATYFKHNTKERVCFDLEKETSAFHKINFIFGLLTMIMVSISALICFIWWLFDNDDNNNEYDVY